MQQAAWTAWAGSILIPLEKAAVRYSLNPSDQLSLTSELLLRALDSDKTLSEIESSLKIGEGKALRLLEDLASRKLLLRHQAQGRYELSLRARELLAVNGCMRALEAENSATWINLATGRLEDTGGLSRQECEPGAVRIEIPLDERLLEEIGDRHRRELVTPRLCQELDEGRARMATSLLSVRLIPLHVFTYRQMKVDRLPCLIGDPLDGPPEEGAPIALQATGLGTLVRYSPRCDASPDTARALSALAREDPSLLSSKGRELSIACQHWEELQGRSFTCLLDQTSGNVLAGASEPVESVPAGPGTRLPSRVMPAKDTLEAARSAAESQYSLPKGVWLEQDSHSSFSYTVRCSLAAWLAR